MPTIEQPQLSRRVVVPEGLRGSADNLRLAIEYIDSGITWDTTAEGHQFWGAVCDRLRSYQSHLRQNEIRPQAPATTPNAYPELQRN